MMPLTLIKKRLVTDESHDFSPASIGSEKFTDTAFTNGRDQLPLEHQRRHSRLFERLLLNYALQLVTGLLMVVIVPALGLWGWDYWESVNTNQQATMLAVSLAYIFSVISVQQLARLPGTKSYVLIIPSITICYLVIFLALQKSPIKFDNYYILCSYFAAAAFSFTGLKVITHYSKRVLAVVPFGKAATLCEHHEVGWCTLDGPSLGHTRVDGVVADLQADLTDAWRRFLGDCTIHRIPVYHASKALEMLCGRLPLDHLYEEVKHGSLAPRESYEAIKRALDVIAVLLVMPLVLPIMALAVVAIRLDSTGPAIFKQRRMGLCCRPFTVYKFRSMYTDRQGRGFTENGIDPRVTMVGKFIRKYRVDELPQLFNVLKGDMSLIGPRPESLELTDWYEKDVPYFHYRHVVRPGISGWAQVMQGYAAEVDGMISKLEYDFYYIKNFSFWLDMLIVIRTFKTLLTGFGSR